MDENLININENKKDSANTEDYTVQHYIDALQEAQNKLNNSVSLETHNKVLNENKMLANALANGLSISTDVEDLPLRSSEEICKDMIANQNKMNSVEFAKKSLEYRAAVINETGEDPFVSKGHYVANTSEGFASAENFANALEYCLDYASGDNQLFSQELQRIMIENPAANIINNKLRKR